MASKTGLHSKAYLNSANYGTPTWGVVNLIGDFSVAAAWDWATAPTRETPVVRGARTMLPLSVTGKMRVSDLDANYQTFDNSFHNSASILDMLILNGDMNTNGVTGFRAEFELVKWSEDQALGNILMKELELRPSATANNPKRAVVSGGSPVFTDIT